MHSSHSSTGKPDFVSDGMRDRDGNRSDEEHKNLFINSGPIIKEIIKTDHEPLSTQISFSAIESQLQTLIQDDDEESPEKDKISTIEFDDEK